MLVVLLCPLILSLEPDLADLAVRARMMAKHRKTRGTDPSYSDPGVYRLGSMTFSLPYRVSGSNSPDVAGYAVGRTVLAVIAPEIAEETVFVDAATQDLLQVRRVIDRDGDVTFYEVYKKNPFSVFTNLKFKTNAGDTTGDYNCSGTATAYTAGQCSGWASFNLDPLTSTPVAIPAPPINGQSWGSYTLGGKALGTGEYEVAINGLTDMQIDYSLEIAGWATSGFVLEGDVGFGSTTLDPVFFPIYGQYYSFYGFEFGLVFEGSLGVNIHDLRVNITKPIQFQRTIDFSTRLSGKITTTNGHTANPIEYDVTPLALEDLEPSAVFDYTDGLRLAATTLLDIGMRFRFALGSAANVSAEASGTLDSAWDFGANVETCPCPYLYGKASNGLTFRGQSTGFYVFGYELIRPFDYSGRVFSGWDTPQYCLFSPNKAEEGLSNLKLDTSKDSYIVQVTEFSYDPKDAPVSSAILCPFDVHMSLEAEADGQVFRDLYYPPINWEYTDGWWIAGKQTYSRTQKMILLDPPANTVIRLKSTQLAYWWWTWESRNGEVDFVGLPKTVNIPLGMGLGQGSVRISKADNVEVAKEFPGTGGQFFSFHPSYPPNSVLGVITHSIIGAESYAAPLLSRVFDDTEPSESNARDFRARDELSLELTSLTTTSYPNVTVTLFTQVGGTTTEIGYGNGVRLSLNTAHPGADFGFASPFVVNLETSPQLILNCSLVNGESTKTFQLFTFSSDDLKQTGNFQLDRTAGTISLRISATRSQPNVVFELAQPLSPNNRGVITRVFQGPPSAPISAPLVGVEKYGIIRFTDVRIPSGDYVGILISMPELVPLCEHKELDDSHYFIVLSNGATRFGNDIHIPFRRKDDGDKTYTVSIRSLFSTTRDGICTQGASVRGSAGFEVGCFESVVNGKTFVQNWTVISQSGNLLANGERPARNARTIGDTETWQLRLFQSLQDAILTFIPSLLSFPPGAVSFNIGAPLVDAIRLEPGGGITINCSFAARLKFIQPDGTERIIERGVDGFFTFQPEQVGDLIAVALCDSAAKAYCEFAQELKGEGYTLLEYLSAEGVREIQEAAGQVASFLRGVTKQLVKNSDVVTNLYKTWEGEIKQTASIVAADTLEFIVNKSKDAFSTITAKFGEIELPISPQEYYNNPELVFTTLGVKIPSTGLSADVATFTADGKLVVADRYFDEEVLKSGNVSVEIALGLPENLVTVQRVVEVDAPADEEVPADGEVPAGQGGSSTGVVIGVVVGVVLLIVGIVVAVVLLKSGTPSKGNEDGEGATTETEPLSTPETEAVP